MLYDAVMVAICHFTFIKTIRTIKQRVSPDVKLRLELIIVYQYSLINCNKSTMLMQNINNKQNCGHGGVNVEEGKDV